MLKLFIHMFMSTLKSLHGNNVFTAFAYFITSSIYLLQIVLKCL